MIKKVFHNVDPCVQDPQTGNCFKLMQGFFILFRFSCPCFSVKWCLAHILIKISAVFPIIILFIRIRIHPKSVYGSSSGSSFSRHPAWNVFFCCYYNRWIVKKHRMEWTVLYFVAKNEPIEIYLPIYKCSFYFYFLFLMFLTRIRIPNTAPDRICTYCTYQHFNFPSALFFLLPFTIQWQSNTVLFCFSS